MATEAPPRKKSAKGVLLTPSSSSCFITDLPLPILMEILCRVPIKTLMASKGVCKLWLHLITDPHFRHLHRARAPTEVCFQYFHDEYTIKLHMGNFNSLSDFDPLDVKLNTLFEFPKFSVGSSNSLGKATRGNFLFANSCNGLLCYHGYYNKFAVIWNPCTSEFVTFPAPLTYTGSPTCRGYGLGFSTKANKFKLLRAMGRKEKTGEVVVAEICTIEKSCSWNTVGPCPNTAWPQFATFLQGNLHWVASSGSSRSEIAIHTFDFEDDQFGRLPLPPSFVKNSRNVASSLRRETLGVLADCLFVSVFKNRGLSIWLMKEYGVQDSWTKLFSLGYSLDKGLRYDRCLPITYMGNGEILMKCTDSHTITVFFYNPVLKSSRVIGSSHYSLRVITYRPSLFQLIDSMLGYDVHVMKQREMPAFPAWWKPVGPVQQHGSTWPLTNGRGGESVNAMELRQISTSVRWCSSNQIKTMNDHEQGQELKERLRNELAKVEQLKQQNQLLEERLQEEYAKVKQLKEQIQQSEQLKQDKQTNYCANDS